MKSTRTEFIWLEKIVFTVMLVITGVYMVAVLLNNNFWCDLLSPMLTLMVLWYVIIGFAGLKTRKETFWFAIMLAMAVLIWFVCEAWWGIQAQILHWDPNQNLITEYGYSFTNLFLFSAIIFSAVHDLKKMNKIQVMLDTIVVSASVSVVLWLFVFHQNNQNLIQLFQEPASMGSLFLDVVIYAWINIWAFSTRTLEPALFQRVFITGALVFVVADFIYYYILIYLKYIPNSWIDALYMLSFLLFAIAARMKSRAHQTHASRQKKIDSTGKIGIDILILLAPAAVFIFKRDEIEYFIMLVVMLLVYYVLINFTQKSLFQEKLLELQKRNVADLEKTIEERTNEIVHILNTDYVTGLYNRRYFELMLSEAVKNCEKNEKLSLLYITINKYKAIRHLYGKETLELLQREIAETIQLIALNGNGLLAAYGDDCFTMLIRGGNADVRADTTASEILERNANLYYMDHHAIRMTMNIGISCYPSDTPDANDLVRNADIAMMQAVTKGFNSIQHYNDSIGNATYNRHRLELKLKRAIFDKEFMVHYQPQVSCVDGKLCGFEALIRWYEGTWNLIPPTEFIPVAEEIGLIIPLGYWIMERVAAQHQKWKNLLGREIRLAVNVSAKQLIDPDFIDKLKVLLQYYQIRPETFEIELTESQQIENSIYIMEKLNEIKDIGVSIAIDDFGTGYSSLYYIKNMPIDRIKIAKELIDRIEDDNFSRTIVKMAISIAKVKNITVIAEGVETKEQWSSLQELECDEIQGYYFSRPYPAEEIEKEWFS